MSRKRIERKMQKIMGLSVAESWNVRRELVKKLSFITGLTEPNFNISAMKKNGQLKDYSIHLALKNILGE